jgi:hypothetical protein
MVTVGKFGKSSNFARQVKLILKIIYQWFFGLSDRLKTFLQNFCLLSSAANLALYFKRESLKVNCTPCLLNVNDTALCLVLSRISFNVSPVIYFLFSFCKEGKRHYKLQYHWIWKMDSHFLFAFLLFCILSYSGKTKL